jgi:hypothetical protein
LHAIRLIVISVVVAGLAVAPRARPAAAGSPVGNGAPESCDYEAFATAFAAGGLITFDCGPNPHIIVLEANDGVATTPSQQVTVDGGGLITLSAANASSRRLFFNNSATLTLTRISLINSAYNGHGGAIFNFDGKLVLDEVRIEHTGAHNGDSAGGAIFNLGELEVYRSTFAHNSAADQGAPFSTRDQDRRP